LAAVTEAAAPEADSELVCPHCKKAFTGELIGGASAALSGFKCPHCRLFVPLERAGDKP
jgi:transposase-like protein